MTGTFIPQKVLFKKRWKYLKKKIGLAMLTALTLSSSISASVFAAEPAMDGSGATQITYQPGSSTGGDGDGNTASWTIDYPVKITLDDATIDEASGRVIKFEAVNSDNQKPYTGSAKVEVSLKKPQNNHSNFQIKLADSSGSFADEVRMRLARSTGATINNQNYKDGQLIATTADTQFAELNSSNQSAQIIGFLVDKSQAKKTQTYSTTLTWKFHSNEYK